MEPMPNTPHPQSHAHRTLGVGGLPRARTTFAFCAFTVPRISPLLLQGFQAAAALDLSPQSPCSLEAQEGCVNLGDGIDVLPVFK